MHEKPKAGGSIRLPVLVYEECLRQEDMKCLWEEAEHENRTAKSYGRTRKPDEPSADTNCS